MSQPIRESDYRPRFGTPVAGWHRWFAWRPVATADRGWVWLRLVHRRRVQLKAHLQNSGSDFWFQYAVAGAQGVGG